MELDKMRTQAVLEELDGLLSQLDDIKMKQNIYGSLYMLETEQNKILEKLSKSTRYIKENFDYREFASAMEDEGFYLENEDVLKEILHKDDFNFLN